MSDTTGVADARPASSSSTVLGPCTPWAGIEDLRDCGREETCGQYDPYVLDDAFTDATMFLYLCTGGQYPGICSDVVRPCSADSWWRFCGCRGGYRSSRACGCAGAAGVTLGAYPVVSIEEVLIDGAVVDPATYRVDDDELLVRVSTPDEHLTWPCCQDLDLSPDEEGTWQVWFSYGIEVPGLGKRACIDLACMMAKERCESADCTVSRKVTNVNREGVSLAIVSAEKDLVALLPDTVRRFFLAAGVPDGKPRKDATVWSPDIGPRTRRTTWPI